MKWPAMTMGFLKPDAKTGADVRAGDTVHFRFKEGASGYELVEVHKITGASK
jgi:Cu(I)/Ag(I) efflux system membrane fusion protein